MIEIVPYNNFYRKSFAILNYEWLQKYFHIEDYDRKVLESPEEHIIKTGGQVFFALNGKEAIGTAAMIAREEGIFELSKMAVTPAYQGQQIGLSLIEVALSYAREQKAKKVFLDSNRKLHPALALYKSIGFGEICVDPNTPYERCDIRMEILL